MFHFLTLIPRRRARTRYEDKIRDQYDRVYAYLGILELSSRYAPLMSSHTILLHGKLDFGASPKAVVDWLGRPGHAIHSLNPVTETIFIYRYQLEDYRIRDELHFSSHGLFYVSRTFSSVATHRYPDILRMYSDKYLDGSPFDGVKQKIVDSGGREILPTLAPTFTMGYVATSHPAFLQIAEHAPKAGSKDPDPDEIQKDSGLHDWL
ncbi:MAG: hypothetical protein EOM22_08475 [Gammaproteobacteria bacterium]|nr:hypothetical protein [Gammaproteobacteria bacterium]